MARRNSKVAIPEKRTPRPKPSKETLLREMKITHEELGIAIKDLEKELAKEKKADAN